MAEPAHSFASAIEESPLGPILLVTSNRGVCLLQFVHGQTPEDARMEAGAVLGGTVIEEDHPAIKRAWRQILAYLEGRRESFSIPLDLRGSRIHQKVWSTLRSVPFGETLSYSALAGHMGTPGGARTVARACIRNPILLVVPCHRLLTADGHLGSYRAGANTKQRLLALEGSAPGGPAPIPAPRADDPSEDVQHRDHLVDALPQPLTRWLLSGPSGRAGSDSLSPEVWLEHTLDVIPTVLLGELADLLAEHSASAQDATLRDLAHEVLTTLAATPKMPPFSHVAAMRAAARMGSRWFPVLGRRLVGLQRQERRWRTDLERLLNTILRGLLPCPPGVIEWSADLLVRLGAPPDTLPPHLSGQDDAREDGTVAIARAERALANGDGDRVALLRDLVQLYRADGDLLMARDHQLSLSLESDDPKDHGLLQRLLDHVDE